jgi:hypothetical protein
MIGCWNCGQPLPPNATKCSRCGVEVANAKITGATAAWATPTAGAPSGATIRPPRRARAQYLIGSLVGLIASGSWLYGQYQSGFSDMASLAIAALIFLASLIGLVASLR